MEPHKVLKRSIVAWCFYDWANSAFPTIGTTFIFATYFTTQIAENEILGTSQWGKTIALAGFIIALCSPIFGAIADYGGRHKPWLLIFTCLIMTGSSLLWFAQPTSNDTYSTLACIVIATVGFELNMVFYNSLLPTLVPKNYTGRISGWAWGFGYFGGLTSLVIALYGFVQGNSSWLDTHTAENIRICGPFIAVWLIIFSLPLFFLVPDTPSSNLSLSQAIQYGIKDLRSTLKILLKQKNIFYFLLARLFYIDGLNTVFAFGGIYAAGTFHMNLSEVIKFGISINVTAGLGAIALAWADDYFGSRKTILLSLLSLIGLTTGILWVHNKSWFWVLSLALGLFVGPVQAASRSLMIHLAPKKKITEMFGLYAFSGKVTAFFGPWLLAIVTLHFNSQRIGMATIVLFFSAGILLLYKVKEKDDGFPSI